MSINRITLSGNLTYPPELRSTAGGMSVLNFGMAVNDRVKNSKTGEWEDYANFVNCVLFGNRADSMSQILTKGMKVVVDGKIRYSSWEKDGQKHSKIEVIVDNIDLPPRTSQQPQQGYQQQGSSYAQQYQAQQQPRQGYQPRQQPQQQPQISYGGYQSASPQAYQPPIQQAPQVDVYDEDIPFSGPTLG